MTFLTCNVVTSKCVNRPSSDEVKHSLLAQCHVSINPFTGSPELIQATTTTTTTYVFVVVIVAVVVAAAVVVVVVSCFYQSNHRETRDDPSHDYNNNNYYNNSSCSRASFTRQEMPGLYSVDCGLIISATKSLDSEPSVFEVFRSNPEGLYRPTGLNL